MCSLPLQWTANPRNKGIISQLDELPSFRQASLQHLSIGDFPDPTSGNYNVFPTRQEIYDMLTKLRCEKFVDTIQNLMDIIRNEQQKQHDLVIIWHSCILVPQGKDKD